MCTPARGRSQAPSHERRRPVNTAIASRVAMRIRPLLASGLDDLELIEGIADAFPEISLLENAASLALYRAEVVVPGYAMVKPT